MRVFLHHSDYWVTPILTVALLFLMPHYTLWWVVVLEGIALWTLVEYWMHRVLHSKLLMPFHVQHHREPKEYIEGQQFTVYPVIGFFTLGLFVPVIAPVLAGLLIGYCFFLLLHWAMHADMVDLRDPYFGELYRKHEAHHLPHREYWFGVTTVFWDHVFGTVEPLNKD